MTKPFLLSLLISLLAGHSAFATAGESSSGTRGGGDPQAIEFLQTLIELSAFLDRSNDVLTYPQRLAAADATVRIRDLMDNSKATSIRFTSERLKDSSGAEKFALFSTKPLVITVNRAAWLGGDDAFKIRLVALELFGVIGVPDRYAAASQLDVSLVLLSRQLHQANWDYLDLTRYADVITIGGPYGTLLFEPSYHRMLAVERGQATPRTLDVICNMMGFTSSVGATYFDLKAESDKNVMLFDSEGTYTSTPTLPKDLSQYQALSSIYCNL